MLMFLMVCSAALLGPAQAPRLSAGCVLLDSLLRGGLPVGGVTELSGPSGAGKTQLALQLCLCVQYPSAYGGLDSGNTDVILLWKSCLLRAVPSLSFLL